MSSVPPLAKPSDAAEWIELRTRRVTWIRRLGGLGLLVGTVIGLGLLVVVDRTELRSSWAVPPILGLVVGGWFGWRPRLSMDEQHMVVRGPIARREILWSDIISVYGTSLLRRPCVALRVVGHDRSVLVPSLDPTHAWDLSRLVSAVRSSKVTDADR